MSTQEIPNNQKQIIQSNDGDYNGNVHSSFNIDLDSSPGTFKVSKRLTRALNQAKIGYTVQALQIHDGFFYVATQGTDVYRCTVTNDPRLSASWTVVSEFNGLDFGIETDITSFKGLMLVSLGTNIASWNGTSMDDDWWTTVAGGSALSSGVQHTMEVLRTGADTLFITDGSNIRYYNTAAAGTIVPLDTLMTASCFTPTLDRMWAGTYTEVENNAFVYELQVGNNIANQSYQIDGMACLSMFSYNNTPFVITERGYIQAFNGAGFQTVAQFPWANASITMRGVIPGLVQIPPASRAIHPKGTKVKGKYCYIFVDTRDGLENKLDGRSPGGVWVLNLETYSLTHRYSITSADADYGTEKVEASGPLLITNIPETRILVGSKIGSDTGVWAEGTEQPQGYFTTVRHESDSVADAFETFVVKHDTLDDGDMITVKYKDQTLSNFPLQIDDITWLNATQFTTTNAFTNVAIGDEVEIIAGYRAGNLAEITNIEGGTTKTVTINQSLGLLNQLSDIQINRFKTINPGDVEMTNEYIKVGEVGDKNSPSRQYKVIMTGDVTIREVISKSNSKEQL